MVHKRGSTAGECSEIWGAVSHFRRAHLETRCAKFCSVNGTVAGEKKLARVPNLGVPVPKTLSCKPALAGVQ